MTELTRYLAAQAHAFTVTTRRHLAARRHDERGVTTIEVVLWSIAAIGFVSIVMAVLNNYLTTQAAKIH